MPITLSRPVAKIYPNGEFTIGYDTQRRLSKEDVAVKPERVENMFWGGLTDDFRGECKRLASNRVMESTIGLSSVANSPKIRRGTKGISSRAAKMVRNMAYVLERENDKRRLAFVTVTLPQLSEEDMKTVTSEWGNVVKEYFKRLGRKYEAICGRSFEHVSVTEIQEKRYEKTRFVGLHIHSLFVGRFSRKSEWILTHLDYRNAWKQAVEKYCIGEYDFGASENCTGVRRSAEGYIGKYLTKGVKATRKIVARGDTSYLPRTWYSRSISLLRRTRAKVRRSYSAGNLLTRKLARRLTLNTAIFCRQIIIDTTSRGGVVIGYSGKFKSTIDIYSAKDIVKLLNKYERFQDDLPSPEMH